MTISSDAERWGGSASGLSLGWMFATGGNRHLHLTCSPMSYEVEKPCKQGNFLCLDLLFPVM
ncbi:hypothetical protein M404DRAFT_999398, partial [Pisolithus tinctorius Marx 270]